MLKTVLLRAIRVILAVVACCLLFSLLLSKYALSVTHYELPLRNTVAASTASNATPIPNAATVTATSNAAAASASGIRIVQLTDLHNSQFGPFNAWLVSKVASQHPDLIFLTGDLLNADNKRTDIAVNLIEKLSQIAPTYISYGNHEMEYEEKYGTDLKPLYESAGGTVLERSYVDVTVQGVPLRIGGLYGYCLRPDLVGSGEANPQEVHFLEEFQHTDRKTMLLCHMPAAWLLWGSLDAYDIDTVWAGHVHGGQVIIPRIGGLYGPDFGWFPGRLQGLYSSEDGSKTLILSRGLGNRDKIPRLNNIPEIMVVDLGPDSGDHGAGPGAGLRYHRKALSISRCSDLGI